MSAAVRAVVILGLFVTAFAAIYIYTMSGGGAQGGSSGGSPARPAVSDLPGYDDPEGYPVKLEEQHRPPYGWRIVSFHPTFGDCVAMRKVHMKQTGRQARCRKRG